MIEISRRDIILSSAAAAALLGLDKKVAFIDAAVAQKAPEFMKYKVGDVEAYSLHDGVIERPLADSYIKNVKIDDVKAALKAAGRPEDKVTNPFTMTLLKVKGKTVLIDAGTGGQLAPTAGYLHDTMKSAGLDPAKVDAVLISHFHPDHIFGLMAKDTNAPIYPNAEILVPETEYKFWTDPGVIAKLPEGQHGLAKRIQAVFPTWKNIKQFVAGAEVVPGVRSMATPGHTPGHTAFVVGSGASQLIVQGDAAGIPYLFVKNPGWHLMFDMDAAAAEATRRKLYDQVVADKAMVAGYHFGFPNVGTIAKDGNGYAFTAIKA